MKPFELQRILTIAQWGFLASLAALQLLTIAAVLRCAIEGAVLSEYRMGSDRMAILVGVGFACGVAAWWISEDDR